ncbi:MAG: chloride channel protein, partial [Leptolyngbyaceae bacterium]|nr:chloride channel protein [Leptolyngbyaceae bacterium]
AAGLAAGFNAPIAGILFVVEELIHDFSGLTLGTAILSSFIGAVVARLLGDRGLSLNAIMAESQAHFYLQDVPFFLLLGLLAGVLGATFSRGIFASVVFNRRFLRKGLPWKIGLAGLVSGLITMLLPQPYWDNIGLPEFLSQGQIPWQFALIGFLVKFLLTLIAAGSGAPGGIFAPALILGSSLGFVVGTLALQLQLIMMGVPFGSTDISPAATYALAGMGAFFSAVTKGPITAIVIVFEMTTDFNLVLPLMISSVVSYLTSDWLYSGSIYNRLLSLQGIHLNQPRGDDGDQRGRQLTQLTAETLMQPKVETLTKQMRLRDAVGAFARSHHRGFPVIHHGKLVGIVTQTDIADSTRQSKDLSHLTLGDIMTPHPVTVKPSDPLSHILYLLNRFKISRLPVTEGQRLVGIITRADIIRAESDQLGGNERAISPTYLPSYVIYRTQAPRTGQGRLLVLVRNPKTIPQLMRMARAIACDRQYEIDCLHIMVVPRSTPPDEIRIDATSGRQLLERAEQYFPAEKIPIHTHIRVTHDAAQATLEAIRDHHIDLVLLGWRGSATASGRVFGDLVDTLIRQAPCDVMVVKLSLNPTFERWLMPVAGGPNVTTALRLLPSLATLGKQPSFKTCQVFTSDKPHAGPSPAQEIAIALQAKLHCSVASELVWNPSISEGVLELAWHEQADVIVLGASREGLLQQAIKGNIPETIARRSMGTVILVRGAIPHSPKLT